MEVKKRYEMPLYTDVIQSKVRQLSQEAGEKLADELGYAQGERRQGFVECFVHFDEKKRYKQCISRLSQLYDKVYYYAYKLSKEKANEYYQEHGLAQKFLEKRINKYSQERREYYLKLYKEEFIDLFCEAMAQERLQSYFAIVSVEKYQLIVKEKLSVSLEALGEFLRQLMDELFDDNSDSFIELYVEWAQWNLN